MNTQILDYYRFTAVYKPRENANGISERGDVYVSETFGSHDEMVAALFIFSENVGKQDVQTYTHYRASCVDRKWLKIGGTKES